MPVAASTGTSITLYVSTASPTEGENMTFTGRVTRSDTGAGVAGVTVKIYDQDDLFDDLMASGTTDSNGNYSISWTAVPMDPTDRTVELYAKFEGSSQFNASQTSVYSLTVGEKVGTTLTLYVSTASPTEGQTVTFTGKLTRNDTSAGVSGATIEIYDDDLIGDDLMASGTTDSNGNYSITWTATSMDPTDRVVEDYAKFGGTSQLSGSQTSVYSLPVAGAESTAKISFVFYNANYNYIANTPVYIYDTSSSTWKLWGTTDSSGKITDSNFPYTRQTVYFKPSGYNWKSKFIFSYDYGSYYDTFSREETGIKVTFTFYNANYNYIANTPVYIYDTSSSTWKLWGTTDSSGKITDSNFPYLRKYVYFKPSGYDWKCKFILVTGGTYSDTFTLESGESPGSTNKHAIIVTGTGNSQDVFERDGQRWQNYLKSKGYTVEYFLNGTQATASRVKDAIRDVVSKATSNDTIVFVYLGHGGGSYWVGSSDPQYSNLCTYESTLSDTELQSAFSSFNGKLFIFLSSCFSGGMDEVVTNAGTNKTNRLLTTATGPNALGLVIWPDIFLNRGLVNGESGSQSMEGNFSWAKSVYISTYSSTIDYYQNMYSSARISQVDSDWYPHEFDGNPASGFTL